MQQLTHEDAGGLLVHNYSGTAAHMPTNFSLLSLFAHLVAPILAPIPSIQGYNHGTRRTQSEVPFAQFYLSLPSSLLLVFA